MSSSLCTSLTTRILVLSLVHMLNRAREVCLSGPSIRGKMGLSLRCSLSGLLLDPGWESSMGNGRGRGGTPTADDSAQGLFSSWER